MKKLLLSIAVTAALGTTGAAGASGPVFTVVPDQSLTTFASAESPNSNLVLPPSYLTPRDSAGLPFGVLHGYWEQAGSTYGIPWEVLAAINKVESNFGNNMGPSSAGAIGWMQFMPSTWQRWGMDATGDGIADPWNPQDSIFAAARYLAAAGGRTDISRGIFAYNHAQWYVDEVLGLARSYGQNGVAAPFSNGAFQINLEDARRAIAKQNRAVVRATLSERRFARRAQKMYAKADAAHLLSDRLALQKTAFEIDAKRSAAAATAGEATKKLHAAEEALTKARSSAWTNGVAPSLFPGPSQQGDYVFPVGGGPSVVSVGHHHHDYPAADIAAPEGSPLYALTSGYIVDAWHLPAGSCGIGLTMRAANDGREWTYCHMSYEEPSIQTGIAVSAGQPLGLVGSTGHATGPHLHLQLQPAASYPQVEPWFAAFADSAFRWQDAPTMDPGPVFEIVDNGSAAPSDSPAVITFTVVRP